MLKYKGVETDKRDKFLRALMEDYTKASLNDADRKMLDYAVKLTHTPAEITQDDIERLKAACFSERAIHDICVIASYFNFVNRLADGLGVELEARFNDNG